MSNKVTIIGAGSVGATIAYTMAVKSIASEIVLIDINEKKAFGEAMDINQGTAFVKPVKIIDGHYEDAKDSDIVIITSGIARKPGQSRLELAQTNVNIIKSIAKEITKYAPDAIYIIVSNPVDVLTYTFTKISGVPENKVIGSGTLLDTARLRARIAEIYSVNQQNVHANVFGEHGDTSFIPWSNATVSNIPVKEYSNYVEDKVCSNEEVNFDEIIEHVRKSGGRVIESKGATFYAVAISVCHLCECIFSGIDTSLTVSTLMHGEYGIEDVCLSVLTIVGKEGVRGKVLIPLTDEEKAKLDLSAKKLREVIDSVEI